MRTFRLKLVFAFAAILGVPIKIRDTWFGMTYGVSPRDCP